jgi:tetratricopeptide (TPR) repeat protein
VDRGLAYGKNANRTEALNDFDIALQLSSFDNQTAQEVAKGYKSYLGEYEMAIDIYTRLIGQNPQKTEYYYQRAVSLAMLDKPQEAIGDFASFLDLHQDRREQRTATHAITRTIIQEIKKPNLARQWLYERSQADSMHQQEWITQSGIIAYNGKLYKEAIRDFSVVIAQRPIDSLYAWRAKALLEIGESPMACVDWREARSLGYKPKHSILDFFCEE